jgi:hypothetical protein
MQVMHPAVNLIFDILPRDPQRQLRSSKLVNGTALCELLSNFISSYPGISSNPIQSHSVPGRGSVQYLWALLYKWRYLGSLLSEPPGYYSKY